MHITSRLQDRCCSSNYHIQVQGKKKGEGADSATTFSCTKKVKALQKLPCRLLLASHWKEMEHLLMTSSLKGGLGSWQSNGRGLSWLVLEYHDASSQARPTFTLSKIRVLLAGRREDVRLDKQHLHIVLLPLTWWKQESRRHGTVLLPFFFFFLQDNLNSFEHVSKQLILLYSQNFQIEHFRECPNSWGPSTSDYFTKSTHSQLSLLTWSPSWHIFWVPLWTISKMVVLWIWWLLTDCSHVSPLCN